MRNRIFISILSIYLLVSGATSNAATPENNSPDVSFGAAGSFGYFDLYSRSGGGNWESGIVYGGGFIFEKMFSNRLGIHSGMLYSETRFEMVDSGFKSDLIMRAYGIPLYMITSLNAEKVSLNILTGFTFSHILSAKILGNSSAGSQDIGVLQYLEYNQAALSVGLNLKFRAGRFTDFFIGCIGDFHLTKFVGDTDGKDLDHMYNIRGITGFLLRTNLFPVPE